MALGDAVPTPQTHGGGMDMRILVTYASKHGATRGIAERIAERLAASGHAAEAIEAGARPDVTGYDAFVIGSAAYMGSWLKEAAQFVRANRSVLNTRPVWFFSSGPLGTATTDSKGRDVLVATEPKEFAEFKEAIGPRDLRVFFGALDPAKLGLSERLIRSLPAGKELLPEGDFRDWTAIEAWADAIARALTPVALGGR